MQVGTDLLVAVGLDDSRSEKHIAVGGDDEAKVHEATDEEIEV